MVEETAMVVDSERRSWEFICFNMRCYNYLEPEEQESEKRKKKKKTNLESVDEGQSKNGGKVEAA